MKKLRTAVYARHSTTMQDSALSSDQAAACLQLIVRLGGILVGRFSDPETSGRNRRRRSRVEPSSAAPSTVPAVMFSEVTS
ncbi:MAG: hypothetical protein H7311_00170 [Ramlibacter sp.]|nr:hypothetical protein [Cryobacterium sp.]